MLKKRIHFLIVIGVLLIGFVVGSFLDLPINETLFSKNNGFGLWMASFGVYPCYAGLAFIGGGLLSTTLKRKELPLLAKIISYGLSAASYVMSVYLCGRELPSVNGYNVPDLAILSYAICAVLFGGVYAGAFFVCKKGDERQLWTVLMIMAVIFIVSLLPAGFVIKLIFHRPRYRYLVRGEIVTFKNWWEMFPQYKSFLDGTYSYEGYTIVKEEFKSFPSGHSGTGMIMAMFLPYASYFFPKLKGKELLLFYIGVTWGLVMMFSRLLVGAHYLTDTCMGSLIVMVVYFVVNEFSERKGWFELNKQEEPVLSK